MEIKYQKMYSEKYSDDMDYVVFGDFYIGPFFDQDAATRAVALLSPPRQQPEYEYVNVGFEPSEIWKAFKEHQEESHLFVGSKDGYESLGDGVFELAMAISQGDQLFRRIEKPKPDWRDVAKSEFDKMNSLNSLDSLSEISEALNFKHARGATGFQADWLRMCVATIEAAKENGELK